MIVSDVLKDIVKDGIWTRNPCLVQLLGLCPLMGVSTNLVTSIGLGMATLIVLVSANFFVALIRSYVDESTRLPAYILVIATFVTLADMLIQAYAFDLHQRISLFVALIVTNCAVLGRAEVFASKNPIPLAALDGLMMGVGFFWVVCLLGAVREVLGAGTLFANMHLLFGEPARGWVIHIASDGLLIAILPPGAFMLLGLLIAAKNYFDQYLGQEVPEADPSIRVRIDLRQLD